MTQLNGWALTLGASSGFGEAASLALARAGLNIFGVHLDRKATMANVERITGEIKALGREAVFFNVNAADADKRAEIAGQVADLAEKRGSSGTLRVLLHSLAFGTLKLYVADPMKEAVTQAQMDMTLDVMAHSLVYWTQEVVGRGLMTRGGRIYAMTSSGGTRVLPFYGPVSAAKAALESHIRQLASELAPQGITANAIRAGVTDTPALQKIPRHDAIIAEARRRNPSGRMTTTEDVARAIVVLEKLIESKLRSPVLIAVTTAGWAIVMWIADRRAAAPPATPGDPLERVSLGQALTVGCAQALALIPGTSRSGITITAGLLGGFDRATAARFAFLLGIPITAGAGSLKALHLLKEGLPPGEAGPLAAALVTAFVSGWFAVWFLVSYLKTRSLRPFVVYRLLLALVIFLVVLRG